MQQEVADELSDDIDEDGNAVLLEELRASCDDEDKDEEYFTFYNKSFWIT